MKTTKTNIIANALGFNKDIMYSIGLHNFINMITNITLRITLTKFFYNFYTENYVKSSMSENILCDIGVCPICLKENLLTFNPYKPIDLNNNTNNPYMYSNNYTLNYIDNNDEKIYTFKNLVFSNSCYTCLECSNNKYRLIKRCKQKYINNNINVYIRGVSEIYLVDYIKCNNPLDILKELAYKVKYNEDLLNIEYTHNNINDLLDASNMKNTHFINKHSNTLLENIDMI